MAWAGELGYGVRPSEGRVEAATRRQDRLMRVEMFTFLVAGAICLGGALGVVLFRNPVHNALSLVATLFGVAVLFIAQEAYFLAAIQVIVYAGAIVVLFLFVIMLLGVDRAERDGDGTDRGPAGGRSRGAASRSSDCPSWRCSPVATTGIPGSTLRGRPERDRREPDRPGPVHRLRVRGRDHRGAAHDRSRRRGGAGPSLEG